MVPAVVRMPTKFFVLFGLRMNEVTLVRAGTGSLSLWPVGPTASPSCRLYPPACKPYGLEAKPEAGGNSRRDIMAHKET